MPYIDEYNDLLVLGYHVPTKMFYHPLTGRPILLHDITISLVANLFW